MIKTSKLDLYWFAPILDFKQEYKVGQTIKVKLRTTVHFAQHFEWLRRLIGVDERQFIVSMSRSKVWDAKGGKSRSPFSKTLDDRWILKGIAAVELESFLQFAPQYFDYLSKVYFQQVPTALAKIVGIYSVVYKRGNKSLKQDFLVMENLFYKRSISKVFTLFNLSVLLTMVLDLRSKGITSKQIR